MADTDDLAAQFELHRAHLHDVAYRVLGSASDADDAVQETWLRLSRTDVSAVLNLRAWLTTVAGRVALNMLDSRKSRREDVAGEVPEPPGPWTGPAASPGPEDETVLGEEVSTALQVVLDTLEPRERVAFVLHDLFAVPFDDIAPVLDGTSGAARQLASRARRRLRTAGPAPLASELQARADQQRAVVDAFFAAAREAQFAALLAVLDPDVVMRADATAAGLGAEASVTGADVVAQWMSGRAQAAVPATVGGEPGAVWLVHGEVRVAFAFTVGGDGRISAIDLIGDPAALAGLDIVRPGQAPGLTY
jgi:RNA polymerase sigma-70 factor (ECF subfamily)